LRFLPFLGNGKEFSDEFFALCSGKIFCTFCNKISPNHSFPLNYCKVCRCAPKVGMRLGSFTPLPTSPLKIQQSKYCFAIKDKAMII